MERAVGLVPGWEDFSMQARAPPVAADTYSEDHAGTYIALCQKEMVWGENATS